MGAAHGGKGRTGNIVINPDTDHAKQLPTRYADYPLKGGDCFRLDTPGGGGFANGFARDPALVLRDLREGYVTLEGARRDYGVAAKRQGDDYAIDENETARLRASAHGRET
jgi:N-methylhydantoinase B